jgi:hypothetical protein
MKTSVVEDNQRLRLKQQPHGWFAAGEAFNRAVICLSDGAFKLFALLCLRADRHSGSVQATHKELATALGKSRRALGSYVAELDHKQVCVVKPGANQHATTSFEIRDDYWPYVRLKACEPLESKESNVTRPKYLKGDCQPKAPDLHGSSLSYVASIRASFLAMGCVTGRFSTSDERVANQLEKQGVSLATIKDALVLGSVRKYLSWINNGDSGPIGSLKYFELLIEEVQQQPWPSGYREYLWSKHRQYSRLWAEQTASKQNRLTCGIESFR